MLAGQIWNALHMPIKLLTSILFILLSVVSSTSWASGYYLQVSCNPQKQVATIFWAEFLDEDPSLEWHGQIRPSASRHNAQTFKVTTAIDYGECFLSRHTPLRVKISEGQGKPYGMCGADPEIWISLWVGQRHWIKKEQITGRCAEKLMSQITVTKTGLTWCSTDYNENNNDAEAVKEECEFISASKLPKRRDKTEYPVSDKKGPPPGTIILESSTQPALCESMIKKKQLATGRPAWEIEIPKDLQITAEPETAHGLFEYAGHFSRQAIDIDNDGNIETVYGFHPFTHALDADIYYASPGEIFDKKWPNISDTMLWENSSYIFPHQFGFCSGHACMQDDEDGLLKLDSYKVDHKPFTYRFRYLHLSPFMVKDKTHFLLTSLDYDSMHISAVLKPQGIRPPEEVCVFRTVLNHY